MHAVAREGEMNEESYRETAEVERCIFCLELEELAIEHSETQRGDKRMTCPCGVCSPWESSFPLVYSVWNKMQRALAHIDG